MLLFITHPALLTVALVGPARRQQSPGRRPEGASLTGARQRRLCPLLRLITREYRKRFVDLGRCVRQNFSQGRSDVLASVVSLSGELRPASGARGKPVGVLSKSICVILVAAQREDHRIGAEGGTERCPRHRLASAIATSRRGAVNAINKHDHFAHTLGCVPSPSKVWHSAEARLKKGPLR